MVQLKESGLEPLDQIISATGDLLDRARQNGRLSLEQLLSFPHLQPWATITTELLESGMHPAFLMSELAVLGKVCGSIHHETSTWQKYLRDYGEGQAGPVPPFLSPEGISLNSLETLSKVIRMASALPLEAVNHRQAALLPSQLKDAFQVFSRTVEELRTEREHLAAQFNLEAARRCPDLDALAAQLPPMSALKRFFSGSYRKAMSTLQTMASQPGIKWNHGQIQQDLTRLSLHVRREEAFHKVPSWHQLFGDNFKGIDSDLTMLTSLVAWHAQIEGEFSCKDGGLFSEAKLGETGVWLLEVPGGLLQKLPLFEQAGLLNSRVSLSQNAGHLAGAFGAAEFPAATPLGDAGDLWHQRFQLIIQRAGGMPDIEWVMTQGAAATLQDAKDTHAAYFKIAGDWLKVLADYQALNAAVFQGWLPARPLPLEEVLNQVGHTRQWVTWLRNPQTPEALLRSILAEPGAGNAEAIREWGAVAAQQLEAGTIAEEKFSDTSRLDSSLWSTRGPVSALIDRADGALSGADLIGDFLTYFRLRSWLHTKGLGGFPDAVESHPFPVDQFTKAHQHAVYAALAQEILAQERQLLRFNGFSQSEAQRDFAASDQALLELMRRKVAYQISRRQVPSGYRGSRVSEHTEMALLSNELSKETRHIPIRQLLNRAGGAVQALKPCFMMGPRSVAQFIAPEGLRFDLLVIDEASQMRPADALGMVARCGQLVVVGDSKQLAPTSFFDKMSDPDGDEEADEQFQMAVAESILDAVAPIFTSRQLRWHYRSRHESLIAFSNYNFYGSNLMIFPSPSPEHGEMGIRYVPIPDGCFESLSSTNRPEALQITDRVEALLLANPGLSLGVATMNAKQRDLIDRLIEDRAKSNPAFGDALSSNSGLAEPLFVKNLENVQGDEREVILISCTYGKNSVTRKLRQHFGPINSADGWRRLNVLFTRSRTRMEIFSSMSFSDIMEDETSSRGVKSLRGMLHYAETRKLQLERPSGREPDSDFEIAVSQMLSEHGFECDCQVGVSGFFIDLAVKCPQHPGRYLMGIECDGAAYHSAKSARDRDRLRQEILENMGWKIRRIWSTDWFANPHKALKVIISELDQLSGGTGSSAGAADAAPNPPLIDTPSA